MMKLLEGRPQVLQYTTCSTEWFSWSSSHLAIVDCLLRVVTHSEFTLRRGWFGYVRQRPPGEGPVAVSFFLCQDRFSNDGPVPEGRAHIHKGIRTFLCKRSKQYKNGTIAEASGSLDVVEEALYVCFLGRQDLLPDHGPANERAEKAWWWVCDRPVSQRNSHNCKTY